MLNIEPAGNGKYYFPSLPGRCNLSTCHEIIVNGDAFLSRFFSQ